MSIELTNEMIAAIDASLKADAIKAAKGALAAGKHTVDFTVRISGVLTKGEDEDNVTPTVTTPWLTVLALFVHRSGMQRDAAMNLILGAMTDAMENRSKEDEENLMSVSGVAEARELYATEVLAKLPKMRKNGKVTSKVAVEVVG